jgi:outer membrane lipoprotein SlyB
LCWLGYIETLILAESPQSEWPDKNRHEYTAPSCLFRYLDVPNRLRAVFAPATNFGRAAILGILRRPTTTFNLFSEYPMTRQFGLAFILGSVLALAGCASSLTGETYSREEARTPQIVRTGVVESVRPVKLEGTKTIIGPAAGAVIGGVAGSGVGGGRGSAIAAVVGALAGGMAGAAAEEGITRTQGVEITVREDDGSMRAYVQEASPDVTFNTGDRVRVQSINGRSRVVK